ncbi:MAG: UDP-3-O-acyl-N-acetylglucosamine deacetylase [Microvirga sp.]
MGRFLMKFSRQTTLRAQASVAGVGVHSGLPVTLTLGPAPVDAGFVFIRTGLEGSDREVQATAEQVIATDFATVLGDRNGPLVSTAEHVLAALRGMGVDNAIIEIDGPEVPIMDGSAAPFVYLILNEAGVKRLTAPKKFLKVLRPISLSNGDKRIALYPSDHFKVTYSISFDHPLIRHQSRTMKITDETFVEEIAPARTFGFLKEVEMLRQRGLALGGSLDNAIVLGETGVLNNALRFEDEFVRHKILDAIGDLSLVGYPVIGHLVAHRAGHALHTAFASRILEEVDAWKIVESDGLPSAVRVPVAAAARLAN